ncbi:MAG: response regulator [Lachnospiraceae bacterium]|nr:response regulator [Lachnospiraceae bacterium]
MIYYKAQIYSMFVIGALFLMCSFGIKEKDKENKIFIRILICGFINLIFDVVTNYTVNHLEIIHPLLNRIVHLCFFNSMAAVFTLLHQYLVALIESEVGRELKRKGWTMIPYFVFTVMDCFLPLYYVETENGNYSYGVAVFGLYACIGVYLILIIELIMRYQKDISKKNKVAVGLALASSLGASLFQVFFPAALTSSLGIVLFCLCTYMTVANPDAVLVRLLKEETARADAANRAKSDFLARMSHEIRTPINAILGMDEMILREGTEPEIKKYAHDIKSSASALLSIINEILDSSKIESGKMELVKDNYEISSLLNDLYNMISVRAKGKGLSLIFDIDPSIPTAYYGDDLRIRQVLVNLLTNGVKYTKEGSVTLRITGRVEGENAVLHFSVKDTGIGIKPEDLGKLFARFERIDEAKNRHVEGTGLGMSIAMQLLNLMDSELKVISEYGVGSEFYFELVQKVVKEDPLGDFHERVLRISEEYEYDLNYTAPDARILIVDDNEMNRKVFCNLLKQTQIRIYEAGSGEESIGLAGQQEFDIIFLDYMMPNMDGVETLQIMKEKKLCEATPVIMLTANAVVGAREQYLNAGFDDYLAKPIAPEKLDKMILQYLPRELVREGAPVAAEQPVSQEATLPQLEEFDFAYAMNLLRSEELLRKTLEDFFHQLGGLPGKLSPLYERINEEEQLALYRIEVHGLKSTAATVGALLLSKLARLLEVAAINGDIKRIITLHPVLLEEMEKHRERIGTMMPKEEKTQIGAMEEILPYLDMLQMNLENDDYAAADYVCEVLKKYQYTEKIQFLMEELCTQVMNLEAEDAIITIDKIKKECEG